MGLIIGEFDCAFLATRIFLSEQTVRNGTVKRERNLEGFMKKILLTVGLVMGSSAFAQVGVQLGTPAFGGNGCPAGTASASISNDGKAVSILFDQYVVEAGRPTNRRLDRKSCNVSVPVHVPNGYSVAVFKVDYRGFNALPRGASSQFNVEYFFAGSRGPRYTRDFTGPLEDEYMITNNLVASSLVWSACGEQVILRANSSMRATTNSRNDQTLATVDSADVQAGLVYHLQFRRCR